MKEEFTYDVVKDNFTQFLEKKKMRKTPERYAILEKIYDFDLHFDAEALFQLMQSEYRVSLATIYNTIELLMSCNLIVKHQFPGQTAKYEKNFGKQTHHHLICTKCGSIKEFSDKKIRTVIASKSFATFDTTHYSLCLYGLCSKCKPPQRKGVKVRRIVTE